MEVGCRPGHHVGQLTCRAVHPSLRYSKGEINRAGDVIRRAYPNGPADVDAYERAVKVVADYRASHSEPLVTCGPW